MSADPEILELFRAELDAHLPVLSNGLLAMEKGGVEAANVEAMMRAAHSIKGAARIVGVDPAVRVAHAMEDCFSAARKGAIVLSSEGVDILLQGVDALQQICAPSGAGEVAIDPLLAELAGVRDGRVAPRNAKVDLSTPAGTGATPAAGASTAPAGVPAHDRIRIAVPAVLDDLAADLFRRELLAAQRKGAPHVQLDFSALRQISAGGLALLVAFVHDMARYAPPRTVAAEGVTDDLRPLWRVARLEALFAGGGH
jgi:two-component system sensor histidine kinase and response regulator WspE